MVILSAAIVTSGKTLLARQFVEMTRLRVEGLLSAFPNLVDSGRDHTYIETETVRYVYQPLEELYLVMITNRSSNIIEDLETLRLLGKVVQDRCQAKVSEELVVKQAFDIIFAFDEVVSFGHRESVTLSQIKTYMEMDSHEEKLHQMIEQSKINEAKEIAKRKQLEISKQRADQKRQEKPQEAATSISSIEQQITMDQMHSFQSESGGSAMTPSPSPWSGSMSVSMGAEDSGAKTIKANAPTRGMALARKKPTAAMDELFDLPESEPAAVAAIAERAPAALAINPLLDPVTVTIEEKISASFTTDGSMNGEAECSGLLQVTVLDATKAGLVCFRLSPLDQKFKYRAHPNLNKASQASGILEVKDASKALHANAPAPLLRWNLKSSEDDFLPITLSCWPSPTADGTQVVLEFELQHTSITLEEVHVRFPAPPASRPAIQSADVGEANYDAGTQTLHWYIPRIDASESSGALEFTAGADQASLLPFTVEAVRRGRTLCPMVIEECYHQNSREPLGYACELSSIYEFTVGA
jgi:hypothetical protein